MELTNIQQSKVNELKFLYNPSNKVKVNFKAPTGSGKTLMATAFISELIEQNPNDKFVFVIATPSSAELPFGFEQKMNQYKVALGFSNFIVEYIKSPSEDKDKKAKAKSDATYRIIPEQNKVYIFGKSSFGIDRIFSIQGTIKEFVAIIEDYKYKLIYIRDEAHIGGRITTDDNFESLMQNNAQFVLKMTATPDYQHTTVTLSEKELNDPLKNENKYLLKTKPITLLEGTMDEKDILLNAIETFNAVKEEYKKLNLIPAIHPALLIQVDSKPKKDKEKLEKYEKTLANIIKELEKNKISWAMYFDGNKDSNTVYKDKLTLAELSKNDSDISAIIFKIGPATGWDIPRACMLLQLRNVCSENFNLQTIGRIKRNCYPKLEKNEITDKYYIYSDAPIEKNSVVFNAKVKEQFAKEEFMSIEITNVKDCSQKVAEEQLRDVINQYLIINKNKFIQEIKEIIVEKNGNIYYEKVYQVVAGGGKYVSKCYDVYIFIKEILKQKKLNQDVFDNCETLFDKFWKNNLKKEMLYPNVPLIKEFFHLILIEKHIADIRNIISKKRPYKPKYKVTPSTYEPLTYSELYSRETHVEEVRLKEYLFETKLGDDKYKQPIGQNAQSPEVIVFNKLKDIVYETDCIKVWGKNLVTSNVNGAYLNEYYKLCHSYFDFIIKFKNNTFLYIEVKSEKDIDPYKTDTLQGAYEEYFKKEQGSLFDRPVVIGVWKVDTSSKTITQTPFYDKAVFSENLYKMSPEELIKTISNFN